MCSLGVKPRDFGLKVSKARQNLFVVSPRIKLLLILELLHLSECLSAQTNHEFASLII